MVKNIDNQIIDKFIKLRNMYEERGDGEAIVFLRHIWIYLYDYKNELTSTENSIVIPGEYSGVLKIALILDQLGYHSYSIERIPAGKVYPCVSTKITFRNTL